MEGAQSRDDGHAELIALLHSFVGLAAVLVGYNSFIDWPRGPSSASRVEPFHMGEIGLAVFSRSRHA